MASLFAYCLEISNTANTISVSHIRLNVFNAEKTVILIVVKKLLFNKLYLSLTFDDDVPMKHLCISCFTSVFLYNYLSKNIP